MGPDGYPSLPSAQGTSSLRPQAPPSPLHRKTPHEAPLANGNEMDYNQNWIIVKMYRKIISERRSPHERSDMQGLSAPPLSRISLRSCGLLTAYRYAMSEGASVLSCPLPQAAKLRRRERVDRTKSGPGEGSYSSACVAPPLPAALARPPSPARLRFATPVGEGKDRRAADEFV